jgi:hypothetical protein
MAKAIPSAEQMGAGWAAGLQGAGAKVERGVRGVTEAPGLAAARAADLWQRRLMEARTKQKFATNVAAIPLATWQQNMVTLGIPRMAQAASVKSPKYIRAMQRIRPILEQVTAQVRAMPKGGLEAGIARATAQMRGMHDGAVAASGGSGLTYTQIPQ